MPISFVWLSVFKCDVCVLNHMWIKPKKIFDCFICNWKCFSSLFVSRFCTYFFFQCFNLVEKQGSESFASCLRVVHDLVVSCEVEKSFLAFRQKLAWVAREFATCEIPRSTILWVFREFWSKTPHLTLLWLHLL